MKRLNNLLVIFILITVNNVSIADTNNISASNDIYSFRNKITTAIRKHFKTSKNIRDKERLFTQRKLNHNLPNAQRVRIPIDVSFGGGRYDKIIISYPHLIIDKDNNGRKKRKRKRKDTMFIHNGFIYYSAHLEAHTPDNKVLGGGHVTLIFKTKKFIEPKGFIIIKGSHFESISQYVASIKKAGDSKEDGKKDGGKKRIKKKYKLPVKGKIGAAIRLGRFIYDHL